MIGAAQGKGKPGGGCPTIAPAPSDTKCYLGSGCLDTSFNSVGFRVGMGDPTLAQGVVNKVLAQPDGCGFGER